MNLSQELEKFKKERNIGADILDLVVSELELLQNSTKTLRSNENKDFASHVIDILFKQFLTLFEDILMKNQTIAKLQQIVAGENRSTMQGQFVNMLFDIKERLSDIERYLDLHEFLRFEMSQEYNDKIVFYLEEVNVIVCATYLKKYHLVCYTTNIDIDHDIRFGLDTYLIETAMPATTYFTIAPSGILFMGCDPNLNEIDIDNLESAAVPVQELIAGSMSKYYRAQIEKTIAQLDDIDADDDNGRENLLMKIQELIDAYNKYSDDSLDFKQLGLE